MHPRLRKNVFSLDTKHYTGVNLVFRVKAHKGLRERETHQNVKQNSKYCHFHSELHKEILSFEQFNILRLRLRIPYANV